MTLFQFNNKIVNEKYRPQFSVPIKNSLKKLIEQCWSDDPKLRPTFEEVFKKLAFNLEESVYDIFEDDDEYKYYLEDIDVNEVMSYVYDIVEIESEKNDAFQKMRKKIEEQDEKIKIILEQNQQMMKKMEDQEKTIAELLNENKLIKKKLDDQEIVNFELRSQILNSNSKLNEKNVTSLDDKSKIVAHKIPDASPAPKIQLVPSKSPRINSGLFSIKNDRPPIERIPGILTFNASEDDFGGIFCYLNKKKGMNIHDSGLIEVTSNSISSDSYHPKNLLDFDTNIFKSGRSKNVWIVFDFKRMSVDLTGYSIKSPGNFANQGQPRSWFFEISKDGVLWEKIDEQSNVQELNAPNAFMKFDLKFSHFARFCRFNHQDECWKGSGNYSLKIKGIELYGNLKNSNLS